LDRALGVETQNLDPHPASTTSSSKILNRLLVSGRIFILNEINPYTEMKESPVLLTDHVTNTLRG
jgi:hypothetical protein